MEKYSMKDKETEPVTVDVNRIEAHAVKLLEELVEKTEELQEIHDDIDKKKAALNEQLKILWAPDLERLTDDATVLKEELDRLTNGMGLKLPDGSAALVVKTSPRRGGKAKDTTLALMEDQPDKWGPPSNFFIDVPASMKLRGMAEIDKTVNALSLDEVRKAELFKLLNISGGVSRTELEINRILNVVDKAITDDREGR